jgi:hypothetical protein
MSNWISLRSDSALHSSWHSIKIQKLFSPSYRETRIYYVALCATLYNNVLEPSLCMVPDHVNWNVIHVHSELIHTAFICLT